jgi:HAD superfamily hydrolase (TIGR02253 family)
MIKAILFDLDNTLIDYMSMKTASCDAAVAAMIANGVNINKEEALTLLFSLYNQYGYEYDKIFQRFLEKYHTHIDYKICAAAIIAYRKAQESFIKPYPRVVPTLLEIKKQGIKIGIVTDAPRLKAWMRLTELGLQDFFDVVVAYGDVDETKPSRLPFEKALDELKLNPEDVLMVGDMPEKDIKGAQALQMKACFARYGWTQPEIPRTTAEYEINKIEELIQIITDTNGHQN